MAVHQHNFSWGIRALLTGEGKAFKQKRLQDLIKSIILSQTLYHCHWGLFLTYTFQPSDGSRHPSRLLYGLRNQSSQLGFLLMKLRELTLISKHLMYWNNHVVSWQSHFNAWIWRCNLNWDSFGIPTLITLKITQWDYGFLLLLFALNTQPVQHPQG